MLLRILKQLRPCLIELMWLEHKPVSLNSLVQDKIKQYFDRAQPSPNTSKNERNLPCRQEVLVNAVLVRLDCLTTQIPQSRWYCTYNKNTIKWQKKEHLVRKLF